MNALVFNLATQAPYWYSNYAFTGYATHGTQQFACGAGGLYELVGDDDDNEPIIATFTTSFTDLGTPLLKTIEALYLGYVADGQLNLTVRVGQPDNLQEVSYTLDVTPVATSTARIKLGKGLKGRYWQFTLDATDGAAFDLETMDLLPVVRERRI